MNLLTLSDILPVARRFVDSGAVCDPNALIDAIHEANQRLLLKADWPHTTMLVRAISTLKDITALRTRVQGAAA